MARPRGNLARRTSTRLSVPCFNDEIPDLAAEVTVRADNQQEEASRDWMGRAAKRLGRSRTWPAVSPKLDQLPDGAATVIGRCHGVHRVGHRRFTAAVLRSPPPYGVNSRHASHLG